MAKRKPAKRKAAARKNPAGFLTSVAAAAGKSLLSMSGKGSKRSKGKKRKAKKRNPGTGAFKRCVSAVAARGTARSPRGVCAPAGRKKYGKAKFQKMAAAGKKARHKGRATNPKRARRNNPVDAAAETYRHFHGKDPETVTEIVTKIHEHSVLSGIGKLEFLTIAAIDGKHVVTLGGFAGALLTENEARTQLFISGGNQAVNLGDFGIRKPVHEIEALGSAVEVAYITAKAHLVGPTDRVPYVHKFGKKDSRLPMVIYDVRNKLLTFAGGGYDMPEEGIRG